MKKSWQLLFFSFSTSGSIICLVFLYYLFFIGNSKAGVKNTETYSFPPIFDNFERMEADGIIKNALAMKIAVNFFLWGQTIKRGVYTFSSSNSIYQILKVLSAGREDYKFFTILEGSDSYDLDRQLFNKGLITNAGIFLKYTHSMQAAKKLVALGLPRAASLEGYLFPDTYKLAASENMHTLVDLALRNFKKKMAPIFESAGVDKERWHPLLTLASLVEKETIVQQEKPYIASVFFNRLRKKMKLRCDPTIIYAMKRLGIYESSLENGKVNIRKKHFFLRSPFNTYYIKGLPPAPIAFMDVDSLKAVLFPKKTNFFFFVSKSLKDHKLGHAFSVTYKEHLKNISLYLK